MSKLIYTSFYTPEYEEEAAGLRESLEKAGIPLGAIQIIERESKGSWALNCLLPGTLVDPRGVLAMTRALYHGQAIEIETRGGARTRLTIEHPVATPGGFVRAGDLVEGDQLFCHEIDIERSIQVDRGRAEKDGQQPVTVEDLFDTLSSEGAGSSALTGVRPLDFHGEAARFVGEVDVVVADGDFCFDSEWKGGSNLVDEGHGLGNRSTLGFQDFLTKLGTPEVSKTGFASVANLHPRVVPESRDDGLAGDPRFRRKRMNRFTRLVSRNEVSDRDRDSDPSVSECPAATACLDDDAGTTEMLADSLVGDPMLRCDLAAGESTFVRIDEVKNIRRFDWRGHVFDLQSSTGVLSSSLPQTAAVVVGNCAMKPQHLMELMADHGDGTRLVWVDADARIGDDAGNFTPDPSGYFMSMPEAIDFGAHWREGQELLSGTLYLRVSDASRTLVHMWHQRCIQNEGAWDQRVLQGTLFLIANLVITVLSPHYCCIPDLMPGIQPVIRHRQASRQLKTLVGP